MSDSVAHRPGARPRRAARRLVQLLVLLLVPVLIVTSPNTAEAATVAVSGQTGYTFSGGTDWAGKGITCSVSALYSVSGSESAGYLQTVKNQGGKCDTGWGVDLQGAALTLTFKGFTPAGPACSGATTVTLAQSTEDPPASQASMGFLPGPATGLCTVGELCWHIYKDSWLPGTADATDESGCVTKSMGVPQLPTGGGGTSACPYGTPQWINAKNRDEGPAGYPTYNQLYALHKIAGIPASVNINPWTVTWLTRVGTGPLVPYDQGGPADAPDGMGDPAAIGMSGPFPSDVTRGVASNNLDANITVVGAQLWYGQRPAQWQPNTSGYTRPASCSFYFGEQIVQDTTTTEDTPFGALGTTSVGADPVEPAPLNTTPPADGAAAKCSGILGAGFCAVVDALTAVWKAITGLAGYLADLPGRIVEGIAGLFRFTPGYLDSKLTQIHNAWSQTSPGMWVDSFTGWLVMPTDSSCGGIPVDYTLPGKDIHMDIGDACSGRMASAAAIVKIGISAMVVVGGAMMCMRLVGSGIYDVPGSFGRRDSED